MRSRLLPDPVHLSVVVGPPVDGTAITVRAPSLTDWVLGQPGAANLACHLATLIEEHGSEQIALAYVAADFMVASRRGQ